MFVEAPGRVFFVAVVCHCDSVDAISHERAQSVAFDAAAIFRIDGRRSTDRRGTFDPDFIRAAPGTCADIPLWSFSMTATFHFSHDVFVAFSLVKSTLSLKRTCHRTGL
ncbi:hypothetical protein [Marilutibacter maris]|uniref:hypothetical protein n=1 Tax=Marilutibacter maris TaxID=1605891 RepID=UPI0011AE52FF|nr:hypothetical protein [Lysobacter maris]